MKVGIVGGGSIGLLFAAYMSKVSEVTIYTRTSRQANELNENGVVLINRNGAVTFQPKAAQIADWERKEDIMLLAVKQYQLEGALEMMGIIPESCSLFFLQNGMGHLKLLANLPVKNIFVGSVEHGAVKENGYTVRQNGKGITNAAVYRGDQSLLSRFAGRMPEDFAFVVKPDYYAMLLDKLIVNSVINPLTALLRVENGKLSTNHFFHKAARNLFNEISDILDLPDPEEHFEKIMLVSRHTADNRSSMLKDLEAGRKTEVEAISGFLLDEAKKRRKEAPLTTMLYEFIRGKEENAASGDE